MKRNLARFPSDFSFQLTKEQWENLRSQIVISNQMASLPAQSLRSQIVTLDVQVSPSKMPNCRWRKPFAGRQTIISARKFYNAGKRRSMAGEKRFVAYRQSIFAHWRRFIAIGQKIIAIRQSKIVRGQRFFARGQLYNCRDKNIIAGDNYPVARGK